MVAVPLFATCVYSSILFLSVFGHVFAYERILSEQDKAKLIDQYKLHEKLPLAEQIRLPDLKTRTDVCFNISSPILMPSCLIQVPCSTLKQNIISHPILRAKKQVDMCAVRCINPGTGPKCVPKQWMCDGDRDCLDGSDEDPKYCRMIQKKSSPVCGRYRCLHGGTCNERQKVCDCPDGYTGLDCSLECGVPRRAPRVRRLAAEKTSSNTSDRMRRMINGEEAIAHSWPWMVWLVVSGFSCGGMLIGDQHVLTAAHCTEETDLTQYEVYVGTVEYGGQVNGRRVTPHTVSKRYQHANFSRNMIKNDISILKLSKRVPISDETGYVCLPREQSKDVKIGDRVVVTGWGRTNPDRYAVSAAPNRLMQTKITVFNSSKCPYRDYEEQKQICAGGSSLNRTGICNGDTGGPLIQKVNEKWVLFGITSYSHRYQCAHPTYADGFTRVKHYRNWINEQLKQS